MSTQLPIDLRQASAWRDHAAPGSVGDDPGPIASAPTVIRRTAPTACDALRDLVSDLRTLQQEAGL